MGIVRYTNLTQTIGRWFSLWSPRFNPGLPNSRFVADKVTLEQVYILVSCVCTRLFIFPQFLHTFISPLIEVWGVLARQQVMTSSVFRFWGAALGWLQSKDCCFMEFLSYNLTVRSSENFGLSCFICAIFCHPGSVGFCRKVETLAPNPHPGGPGAAV